MRFLGVLPGIGVLLFAVMLTTPAESKPPPPAPPPWSEGFYDVAVYPSDLVVWGEVVNVTDTKMDWLVEIRPLRVLWGIAPDGPIIVTYRNVGRRDVTIHPQTPVFHAPPNAIGEKKVFLLRIGLETYGSLPNPWEPPSYEPPPQGLDFLEQRISEKRFLECTADVSAPIAKPGHLPTLLLRLRNVTKNRNVKLYPLQIRSFMAYVAKPEGGKYPRWMGNPKSSGFRETRILIPGEVYELPVEMVRDHDKPSGERLVLFLPEENMTGEHSIVVTLGGGENTGGKFIGAYSPSGPLVICPEVRFTVEGE